MLASVAILPVLRTTEPKDRALAQLPAAKSGSFPAPLPSVTSAVAPESPDPASPTTSRPRTTAPAKTGKPTTATTPPPAKATTLPPTKTEDGWTVTTGDGGLRTYVRPFQVAGGQAVIRMTSNGVVTLVTATPAEGFAVQKVQDSPGNMAVYFNETNHSFIIHAVWWDDRPFAEVSEVGG
ncbi:hypothetical protein GCM10010172_51740 [Paractinoplanes ferrugineus]|uniref:DNA mismatch repair protein MutL n=1 Tax=Paractinoplanes ferrugineus TaxID=113564 RepID=A0A919J256_9ACTN|nr:hypothetical protein Afe05nite_38470 [Actinoplanes ferrugineus]